MVQGADGIGGNLDGVDRQSLGDRRHQIARSYKYGGVAVGDSKLLNARQRTVAEQAD
jgi:hypothetical protein